MYAVKRLYGAKVGVIGPMLAQLCPIMHVYWGVFCGMVQKKEIYNKGKPQILFQNQLVAAKKNKIRKTGNQEQDVILHPLNHYDEMTMKDNSSVHTLKTGVKLTPLWTPLQQHFLTFNTFINTNCVSKGASC